MTSISILLAHKHTPRNDAALRIALNMIVDNTRCDYELLVDTSTPRDPYLVYNELANQAKSGYLVFTNSDVFFAPGWDTPFLEAADSDTLLTGVLVEPGAMGIYPGNVGLSFGMTPESFDRVKFEAYQPPFPDAPGWYMPCMIPRARFREIGGFDLTLGAFGVEPLDTYLWEAWAARGWPIRRVYSIAYHLQNWSNEIEQNKPVRYK